MSLFTCSSHSWITPYLPTQGFSDCTFCVQTWLESVFFHRALGSVSREWYLETILCAVFFTPGVSLFLGPVILSRQLGNLKIWGFCFGFKS